MTQPKEKLLNPSSLPQTSSELGSVLSDQGSNGFIYTGTKVQS